MTKSIFVGVRGRFPDENVMGGLFGSTKGRSRVVVVVPELLKEVVVCRASEGARA